MKDNVWKEFLEQTEGNLEWESYLKEVLDYEEIRNLDEAYTYIIEKAKTGRDGVDKLFRIPKI